MTYLSEWQSLLTREPISKFLHRNMLDVFNALMAKEGFIKPDLCNGKYHCTADLLFECLDSDALLMVNQQIYLSNRSAVQWYFSLRGKLAFCGWGHFVDLNSSRNLYPSQTGESTSVLFYFNPNCRTDSVWAVLGSAFGKINCKFSASGYHMLHCFVYGFTMTKQKMQRKEKGNYLAQPKIVHPF